jgi:hypothetical protein
MLDPMVHEAFLEALVLGNSGKPVTLETSSLTKFLRYVFQGREHAVFRNLEPAKPQKLRTCDFQES